MSTPQKPYFIGVALPDPISERIFSLKMKLHDETPNSLKPLVPHITLLHPPSLRGPASEDLVPQVKATSSPFLPLSFSFTTIQDFQKRVLFLGIHSPGTVALQAELVQLLPATEQELYHQRGYIPHITLLQVEASHALDVDAIRTRIQPEIDSLSESSMLTVETISCFTKSGERTYDSRII